MNEIGVSQGQAVSAKSRASAPNRQTDATLESDGGKSSLSVSQAELRQTETPSELKAALDKNAQENEDRSEQAVEQAVARLNEYVQNTERKLQFMIDDSSGQMVVQVFDKSSEELIRQIPNEEALELAQKLNQEEPLMLFSAQV